MISFTLGKGMKYLKGAVLARTRWNMEYVRFLNKNTDLKLIVFNKSSTKLKKITFDEARPKKLFYPIFISYSFLITPRVYTVYFFNN